MTSTTTPGGSSAWGALTTDRGRLSRRRRSRDADELRPGGSDFAHRPARVTVPNASPSEIGARRRLYGHELQRRLLDGVGVGPGDTVLELGSGHGAMCLRLAALVQPGGRTICSDLRPERVAAMQRLLTEAGTQGVDVRVLDMLRIDLPDESVDGIVCRWGFMFPQPTASAFAEALRVLRPGRTLILAVWGDPHRNPWISLVDEAIVACGHRLPADRRQPGQMFSLADPSEVRSLLAGAGFGGARVDEVLIEWEYDTLEA
jgi:SAM-dependent methyltransferase